jgi:hypothetical protein
MRIRALTRVSIHVLEASEAMKPSLLGSEFP